MAATNGRRIDIVKKVYDSVQRSISYLTSDSMINFYEFDNFFFDPKDIFIEAFDSLFPSGWKMELKESKCFFRDMEGNCGVMYFSEDHANHYYLHIKLYVLQRWSGMKKIFDEIDRHLSECLLQSVNTKSSVVDDISRKQLLKFEKLPSVQKEHIWGFVAKENLSFGLKISKMQTKDMTRTLIFSNTDSEEEWKVEIKPGTLPKSVVVTTTKLPSRKNEKKMVSSKDVSKDDMCISLLATLNTEDRPPEKILEKVMRIISVRTIEIHRKFPFARGDSVVETERNIIIDIVQTLENKDLSYEEKVSMMRLSLISFMIAF